VPDNGSIKRILTLAVIAFAAALAGCGGVKVTADNPVPAPLVEELPLKAGVYYSAEFRNYAAHEERWSTKWQVELGAAHVAAIDRLTKAMFAGVTPIADLSKLPATPLDLILEPRFEEYSFLTPRDSGSEVFAVTIKYRINIYDGQARLIDSLVLTGFGNELAGSLSSSAPLAVATRKAMRDAGAKFAAEFPDQPVVQKLLRHEPVEPIAQGSAAAEGSIGEVQPTATKPAPAPRPAPAAAAPATSAPAATSETAPAAAPTPEAPVVAPAPEAAPAASPTATAPAAPPAAPAASPIPPASGAPPTAPEVPEAAPQAPQEPAGPPTAPAAPAAPPATPPPEQPTAPR
jgi:hypothetical protein